MKSNIIVKKDLPERLAQLSQPPLQLQCKGIDLDAQLSKPVLGIVGSRSVSAYGRTVTADFASAAARAGIVIVSGLALGVDSTAHKAALDVRGATIAVLPSGVERIYPANNHNLAGCILESGGTLVSEYKADSRPHQGSFIARNRLIAGLSDAVLITEAAERSGSLHTARFALEQGKPVLAVPGNITSPTSAGTNNLIKMGAVPITQVQDIFEALEMMPYGEETAQHAYYAENQAEAAILKHIAVGIQDGHELLARSGLPVEQFQQHLTMLEIKGAVRPLGNNLWKLDS